MIHVLDTLSVEPGHLRAVIDAVRDQYAPMVAPLEMSLVHLWMSPPVELHDRPTDVVVLWAVADTEAWWRCKRTAARMPEVAAFWAGLEPLITGRTRQLLADPDDQDILR